MTAMIPILVKCTTGRHVVNVNLPATADVYALKGAVARVHPLQPDSRELRLVHAGRLLLDDQKLGDVFAREGGDPAATRVVHVVVGESALHHSASSPTELPSAGTRHRNRPQSMAGVPSPFMSVTEAYQQAFRQSSLAGIPASPPTPVASSGPNWSAASSPSDAYQAAYLHAQYIQQATMWSPQGVPYYGGAAVPGGLGLSPWQNFNLAARHRPLQEEETEAAEREILAATTGAEDWEVNQPAEEERAEREVPAAANMAVVNEGNPARAVYNQLALFAKLCFAVYLFGQHTTPLRFTFLIMGAAAVFLWQGGWLGLARAPRQPVRRADAANLPGGLGDHEAEAAATAQEQPPAPPLTFLALVSEVSLRFFTSLVPRLRPQEA